jgi:hypothetical protein
MVTFRCTSCLVRINYAETCAAFLQWREEEWTTTKTECRQRSIVKSKSKLYSDRRSVGQSILVSGTHLGLATNFSPSLFNYFKTVAGLLGRSLLREVGSSVFSFCWESPAQPFSDLSLTGLMSIFYCPYFWGFPNLEGQVPVFISPRNRVAQLHARAMGLEYSKKPDFEIYCNRQNGSVA